MVLNIRGDKRQIGRNALILAFPPYNSELLISKLPFYFMRKSTFILSLSLLIAGTGNAAAQADDNALDRSGWTVTVSSACDDAGTSGQKGCITDGDNTTYWHSNWGGGNAVGTGGSLPEFINIDLGSVQTFNGFGYMPRPYASDFTPANGDCTSYKLYVSNTSFGLPENPSKEQINEKVASLGTPDMEGDFTSGKAAFLQIGTSNQSITGQYVLFVITKSGGAQANKWGSCAEFNLYKNVDKIKSETAATAKQNLTEVFDNLKPVIGDGFGYKPVSPEDIAETQTVIDDPNAAYDDIVWAMKSFKEVFDATPYNAPTATYYRIVNAFEGFENTQHVKKAIYSNGAKPMWGTEDMLSATQYWKITSNEDGYQIQNVADDLYFGSATSMSSTPGAARFVKVAGKEGVYRISINGSNALHANYHGNGAGVGADIVAYGGMNDAGGASQWYVKEASLEEIQAAANALNLPDAAFGEYVGLYNKESLDAVKSTADLEVAVTSLKTLRNTIDENKYYRLVNVSPKGEDKTRTTMAYAKIGDGDFVVGSEVSKGNVNQVFQFVKKQGTGNYYIKNANTGTFINPANQGGYRTQLVGQDEAGEYEVVAYTGEGVYGKYKFHQAGGLSTYCLWAENNAEDGYKLAGWEGDANSASAWYIVPATDIEVAMNQVEAKTYATAYLPFAVTMPEGVKAYTGTVDGTTLRLSEVSGNVPAGTGVILVGNATSATLPIAAANNATATVADNALQGTYTDKAIDAASTDYYVLATKGGELGFWLPKEGTTTLKANKAYLPASALTASAIQAQGLRLEIGGVTGINTAITDNADKDAAIYDLTGRRVNKPAQGIYIVGRKKVLVK